MIVPMVLFLAATLPLEGPVLMFRQPGLSGDGKRIAFVVNGDVYLGSAEGGEAVRIVDDPVHASHPRFAPSGERIAFTSLRSGGGDVYLVDLASSKQRRLTFHDAEDVVESWSPDGKFVYFSTSRADISGYSDVFAVSASGGTPFPVSRARFEGEYNASVSPDGMRLAFNSNDRVRQWYRMGPRFDDATDIWIKSTDPGASHFDRITTFEGKDSWPLWAPDGNGLYLVTDEYSPDGAENLAFQSLAGERKPVTRFSDGRVSWPTIAADGTIAFERNFRIWTVRDGGEPRPLAFALSPEEIDDEATRNESLSRVAEFHANGRRLAVVIHGDIILVDLDRPETVRITRTPQPESDARLDPAGRFVAYTALRDGDFDLFVYDVRERRERRLTTTPETERALRFSPNGSRIAFAEGVDRIKVVSVEGGAPIEIASGLMVDAELAWSPDGQSIAYVASDENWLSNLWIAETRSPWRRRQLTDFPDVYFHGLSWSPDGRSIYLSTWTTRETRQVARVRLPDTGFLQEDVEVEYILPANESLVLDAIGPGGRLALLSGSSLGRSGLWRASIGERDLEEFSFVAPGRVRSAAFLDDGTILYLDNRGALHRYEAGGGGPEKIELSVDFEIDPKVERLARFRESWLVIRDWYGDETFNGLDWEAVYRRYEPFVRGARNDFDFMTAVRMMLGELNASHTSVWGDPELDRESVAELGVDFDGEALKSGHAVIAAVVPGLRSPLRAGDRVASIDGTPIGEGVNLHQLLVGRVGETVAVTVERDGRQVDLELTTRSTRDVADQRYRAWVARNELLVDQLSEGRFAYVHRRHFGGGSTEELRRQLGASALGKQGVVLDVRYNGGGVESARTIGYLRRRAAHFNAFRDKVVAPGALVHGIPLLDRPVVLVQNEQVLSDTESFSHQFRALGVGPVVGTRTAAWNKGQRGYRLFDGTRVSVGAWKALTASGEDMERRGREPDIYVDRTLQETLEGVDSQLETAVAALEEWIENEKRP